MNKFKHTALTLVATGLLSVQAHASEAHLQAIQPVAAFTQTDINTMFEQADKPMQLAALSAQEMRETEGAMLWMLPVANAALRFYPHLPTVGAWAMHQSPRIGVAFDRFRHR